MKTKLLGVVAAVVLLFTANSAAQANTYSLPLNGIVSFGGALGLPYPGPLVSGGSFVSGPNIFPQCGFSYGACSSEQLALQASFSFGTQIYEYDQAGNLVDSGIVGLTFANCNALFGCGGFVEDYDHSVMTTSLASLNAFSLVTSTNIASGGPVTCVFGPCVLLSVQTDGTLISERETPLPAALPLFASGLGALGLLGWRRKRKNAAAIAA
jgi:hypothetical protein